MKKLMQGVVALVLFATQHPAQADSVYVDTSALFPRRPAPQPPQNAEAQGSVEQQQAEHRAAAQRDAEQGAVQPAPDRTSRPIVPPPFQVRVVEETIPGPPPHVEPVYEPVKQPVPPAPYPPPSTCVWSGPSGRCASAGR